MNRSVRVRWLVAVEAVVAASGISVAPAHAAPSVTRLTMVTNLISDGAKTLSVDGGHVYGSNHLVASTLVAGAPATVDLSALVNYDNGTGPFTFATTFTLVDGSTLAVWCEGTSVKDATGTSHFTGPLSIIGGTGKYAGATGAGSVVGSRSGALGSPVVLTYRLILKSS
ncbi:MAG: hypothetical protein ORN20_07315 [Candidatus Nanopelagicales bacterium]|nr:hypothetical protein [Candidatus Nanopelagicales bacterium]